MIDSSGKSTLILFFLFINAFYSLGQECVFEPDKQFSTTDNLSHNGVTTLFEDSYGFIWAGTYDGLNKYDGYSFKKYRNTLNNTILLSNRITSLNEDKTKKLWIGTENGINILDLKTQEISTVYTNENSNQKAIKVKKIVIGENDNVFCLLENQTLLHFNSHQLIGSYKPKSKPLNQVFFRDIISLTKSKYIITTSSGLMVFNLKTKRFKLILSDEIGPSFGLIKIGNQDLYVVKSHGIAHVKIKDSIEYQNTFLENKRYKYIALDENSTLWLGSVSGLSRIPNFNSTITKNTLTPCVLEPSLNEVYVSSILTNSKNRCWVTTYNQGIYQFETSNTFFNSYNKSFNLPNGIETNTIIGLTHYKDSQFFVSTYFGKTSLFDVSKKAFLPLPFKNLPTDTKYKGAIINDSKKNIWFSPRGIQMGLFYKKFDEDEFKNIISDKYPTFNNAQIRLIEEDKHGCIWVADKKDVYRLKFNKVKNTFIVESLNELSKFTPKFSLIRYIYTDPLYDFVWLGSETNGLYRIDIKNDNKLNELDIENYQHTFKDYAISSNYVSHIMRDNTNSLWIATDQGGICNVINDDKKPKFITYSEKDGLINNGVKRIECDLDNNLWISTNFGINKFITKTKEFRKYQRDDGLPFLQFEFSSLKLPDGNLVFGGREGFVYFNPKDIKQTNQVPNLEFGEFKLFNKTIKPRDTVQDRVLLDKNLSLIDDIELNYNENVFSIEVISLHFKSQKNHFIKYKLSPIDKDWVVHTSSKNTIQYNGLPPGEYTLEVKASNSDNMWSPPKKLNITISPHFLKTKLAYTLYFLFGFLLVGLIILGLLRFSELRYKLKIKQLEKTQESELSDAKLQFFTNISHEFRTPLTLINGPLELFLDKFKTDKVIGDYLSLVKRQSKKILQLVEQAHDFRKAEKDLLQLQKTKFNFSIFLKQLISDFEYLASNDEKKLIIKPSAEDVFILADKNKIEKILNNLINNAFKFTDKEDTITIAYKVDNKKLICTVKDSGRGISNEDLPNVFERFYQSKTDYLKHSGGSGIGLAFTKKLINLHEGDITVESEINNGAAFTFKIPVGNIEAYEVKEDKLVEIIAEELENKNTLSAIKEETDTAEFNIEDSLKNAHVFIVEDNDEMRIFLKNVFSKYFKITSFSNGKECTIALENHWPDLIVSDVMMPVMNGIELCEHVKGDMKTSHIPFILLTAVSSMENKLKGLGVGADAYINKPFQVKHLIVQSVMLLKNRKMLRERFQIDFPQSTEKKQENDYDHIFIEKLINLVDKNINNTELDVNFLARELCISRSHFFQKVKAITNQTPYELIKTYRLKKAAELLVKGDMQVSDVFSYVGFKSMSHFSKAFKKKYNVTPGKYKGA